MTESTRFFEVAWSWWQNFVKNKQRVQEVSNWVSEFFKTRGGLRSLTMMRLIEVIVQGQPWTPT